MSDETPETGEIITAPALDEPALDTAPALDEPALDDGAPSDTEPEPDELTSILRAAATAADASPPCLESELSFLLASWKRLGHCPEAWPYSPACSARRSERPGRSRRRPSSKSRPGV